MQEDCNEILYRVGGKTSYPLVPTEWPYLALAAPDIAFYPGHPFNFARGGMEGWFAKIRHVMSLWTSVGVAMEIRTLMRFYFFKRFKHCLVWAHDYNRGCRSAPKKL